MSTNILTIDVEEWYHLNYDSMAVHQNKSFESRVQANTEVLLETLAVYYAQATFFFLGSVAEEHPQLVRQAQQMGHEIASHGYGHQLVYQQSPAEFAADVKKSLDILQDITGQPIRGYRAPSWSISDRTPWVYKILSELGLVYSASLFPFKTYLYGDSQAPIDLFVKHTNGYKLYEIPTTVLQVGRWRFPFSGGFYFRLLPYWAIRLATQLTHRQGRPVIFYLHPREIDPAQPRLLLPARDSFVSYVNLKTTLSKLNRLLSFMPTISLWQHLKSHLPPSSAPGPKPSK